MVQKARIKLASTDLRKLEEVCNEIRGIADGAKKAGVNVSWKIRYHISAEQV